MIPNTLLYPSITIPRATFVSALREAFSKVILGPIHAEALEEVGRTATVAALGDYTRMDGVCCPWRLAGFTASEDKYGYFGVQFDHAIRKRVDEAGVFRTIIIED